MEYKDYYKTLGIDKTADAAAIKKAYRKLVRQYHPDVSKHKDADSKTKELNEAYGVLGDAEKRTAYDELGNAPPPGRGGFQPPPDWGSQHGFGGGGGGADPNDFFADLFANVGGSRRRGTGFSSRGEDIHASIEVDLSDAYTGVTRNITLRVPQGRGAPQEKTLAVNIPKGVTPGQQLRLGGQGHPGNGGGSAGDLYLEIKVMGDARYRLEGTDVYATVPVTPWEMALGGSIAVTTPSGNVEVNVPAGSQTGRKLRLKGRGIPAATAGDLYLILEVVLPPATSDTAKALYEQMARDLAFNPRKGG